jgi:adenine-specific DNA methylase
MSIPSSCKRLIEVDFPIAAVSAHSAREKSIRHGHPSTLHLWWARRPLAACRSVLLGLLLPDPCDLDCPPDFKTKARELLAKRYSFQSRSSRREEAQTSVTHHASRITGEQSLVTSAVTDEDLELRELLLKFIGEFASWDHAANAMYLEIGRGLVKAAHPEETPVVVDPFAGGGSIPLEALRLGCEAFASDLNPVACLILKTLLEDIPRYGNAEFKLADDKGKEIVVHGLADALRHVGKQVKASAEKELAQFYPPDQDGSRPIAYLWARTVRCEGVGCGAEIPLVRSFWLCKKLNRKRALRYSVERNKGKAPQLAFKIFTPASEEEVPVSTVSRANATCPCCNTVLPAARVRGQLVAQRGGADTRFDTKGVRTGGAIILAVVTLHANTSGRAYRLATGRDYKAIYAAQEQLSSWSKKPLPGGMSRIPDEPTPIGGGSGASRAFAVRAYGMDLLSDLFSARQKLALVSITERVRALHEKTPQVAEALALVVSKLSELACSFCAWEPLAECPRHLFARPAIGMNWDFGEGVLTSESSGSFDVVLNNFVNGLEAIGTNWNKSSPQQADATVSPLPNDSVMVWFTDPPYYDAIPYSDLSDFFFVWLKRSLPQHMLLRDPFDVANPLTPKTVELVQDETKQFEGRPKDKTFFEQGVSRVFREGRRVLRDGGIGCVVFAHKTTEGWEALLSGMISGGWTITASWPINTEMASRLRARDSAALAGSVHLVCRPRVDDVGVGDWTEVKAAMEKRIREWLPTLVKHGVRGADAIFSCLGPALESYSKFEKVLTASDREVPLGGDPDAIEPEQRGFLAYVFETLSKEALHQVLGDAETEGFEEDSRMTALFLWTLQATKANGNGGKKPEPTVEAEDDAGEDEDEGKPKKAKAGFSMPFDTFIRITRPMGIHYAALEHRVIEIEKGIVRLLPVRERSEQLLGEAATRPGIEITLEDVKQLELGLATQRKAAEELPMPKGRGKKGAAKSAIEAFTTLDRLHRAMLLFGLGRSTLLRQVLETELRQSKRFERLALALNALYPENSDERRMLEGVQAAMRGVR